MKVITRKNYYEIHIDSITLYYHKLRVQNTKG